MEKGQSAVRDFGNARLPFFLLSVRVGRMDLNRSNSAFSQSAVVLLKNEQWVNPVSIGL